MVEMEYVIQQNKELRRAADDVQDLRRCVNAYKDNVWDAWKSTDSMGLRDASDDLSRLLSSISKELYEIAHDVLTSAQEYERENEEKKKTEE